MQRKFILTTITVMLTFQIIMAQAPDIEWAKCYGGTSSEVGRCIRQTKDGGYIVVGNAGSNDGDVKINNGGTDCWIVKLNKFGDTVWTRVLGGSDYEYATSVQQTEDEGYVLTAQSISTDGDFVGGLNGNYDCWVIKLDKSGATQWKKRFGGSGGDVPRDIILTEDNGFIVAGNSNSKNGFVWGNHGNLDYWLLRLNKMGDTLWTKSYGGSGNDQVFSIYETKDNGYLLAGQSDSKDGDVWGNHGKTDYWILKINSKGDTLWTKSFGGKEDDLGHYISQTMDGGIIVGGCSQSNNGDVTGHHGDSTKADIWVVKLNSSRDIQWQKSLGGTHDEALYSSLLAFSMMQSIDGGYVIASQTRSNDGDVSGNKGGSDVWLIRLTNSGNIEWQKTFGGTGYDYGHSVLQTNDGAYVVTGMAGNNSDDVSGNHGGSDFWVIKFVGTTNSIEKTSYSKFIVYPNPANSAFTIDKAPIGAKVKITDIFGNTIFNTEIVQEQTKINSIDFANGLYILQIEKNGYLACRKIMVQK